MSSIPDGDTLCSGGGSPSLLAPGELILPSSAASQATWREVPGEADSDRIGDWVVGGINRVNLGVQTFDPALVPAASRKHDSQTA